MVSLDLFCLLFHLGDSESAGGFGFRLLYAYTQQWLVNFNMLRRRAFPGLGDGRLL